MGRKWSDLAGIFLCLVITLFSIHPVDSHSLAQDELPTITVDSITETVTTTPIPPGPTQTSESSPDTFTPVPSSLPTATISESPASTYTPTSNTGQKMKRLLVGTSTNYSNEGLMAAERIRTVTDPVAVELAKIGVSILEVPADRADQVRKELKEDPAVRFAEYDGLVEALDVFPNDPGLPAQYGLINIRAPQGWEISTGSSVVTIAVIDSGVDASHPDLMQKILQGYDFVDGDDLPQDEFGHGTHVSGIAAASSNNGLGVAGVSWGAQILPVRVLDSNGNGDYSTLAAGIIWAVDHGAQILNLSLGGITPNATLHSAVNYAYNQGALLIAASGNDGSGNIRYPARYDVVVAVGSTNSINQRSGFSNYGSGLDLVAPGESIYSTNPGGDYGYRTGTSMSTPFVSGLAAILWGMMGYGSASRVETAMEKSALDLGSAGWDTEYGYGLIQMDRALLYSITPRPQKSHTPQIFFGYADSSTWTPTLLPSPTATLAPVITSIVEAASTRAVPSQTKTTVVEISTITPTPALIISVKEESSKPENGKESLLLLAGSCFILGGVALVVLLVLWKKRVHPSDHDLWRR